MSILFGPGENPFQGPKRRNKQSNNQKTSSINKHDDLLVFGYQCKFFRDNTVAADVNNGKTLIPWMGNKDIMIDRYDCRGHLYRLEDFDFSKSSKTSSKVSMEEMDIESILDEERYKDLGKDTADDAILEEEDEKRSKTLYDPYTAYQSINYSYGDSSSSGKSLSELDNESADMFKQYCQYYGYDENDESVKAYFEAYQKQQQYESSRPPPPPTPPPPSTDTAPVEGKPEPFLPPEGIEIPDSIELPETRRMQSIIEKTASFLSKQNSQMEIVLKTKQAGNPQFGFLNYDHYLNAYYKFILEKIKDGSYTPIIEAAKDQNAKSDTNQEDQKTENGKSKSDDNKSEGNESDDDSDDDDDEGELHPLLQAHRRPVAKPKPPVEKVDVVKPIVEKKPLGRPEDLAKIYMSMKYKSNPEPEEIKDDTPPSTSNAPHEPFHSQSYQNAPYPPFPLPPPPPMAPQELVYSNHMVDYRQRPPPPQMTPYNQEMMPPPNMQQPLLGNNFRPHPQAFPPPLRGGPIPPIEHHSMGNFPPGNLALPDMKGMDMRFRGRPPIRPSFNGPPMTSGIPQPNMPPIFSNNQLGNFQSGPIGPQLPQSTQQPGQYLSKKIGPGAQLPPPPQETREHQELLPPGVDQIESMLPPPPPLPPTPNINEINKLAKESSQVQEEENSSQVEEMSYDKPNDPKNNSEDDQRSSNKVVDENSGSRYRPSEMLSNILKSRGVTQISASRLDGTSRDSDYREDSSYNSPRLEQSSYYRDSPSSRSPAQDYYDSPRSDYGDVRHEDRVSPFARLSESLKILHQRPEGPHPQTFEDPEAVAPKPSVEPSADLKPVIERLAQYVAKNGDEFEKGIREKNDPRFDFLNHWNMYHAFYLQSKQEAKNEMEREKQEELERRKNLKVKFGLKTSKPAPVKKNFGSHSNTASIFNQQDEEEEEIKEEFEENMGFKPNKDTDTNNVKKIQQYSEESEHLYVTRSAARQNATPQQQAALKRKVQMESLRKEASYKVNENQHSNRYNSSQNSDYEDDYQSASKKKYKELSTSMVGSQMIAGKKKDAFHQAINNAFNPGS